MSVDSNETSHTFDVAIIGAGIYGIQAARTYLEIHPNDNVIVFEADRDVGGVWSTERVYDAFWTQTPLRILEFSDLPLENVPEIDRYHDFFPAKYVSRYLTFYIEHKSYAGRSLAARITFQSKVHSLEKTSTGWCLHVESRKLKSPNYYTINATKVIDATGLTSSPKIPQFPQQESFGGRLLHSKDFATQQDDLLYSGKFQDIVVVGGAKSAADIAYACAKAGRQVTWIIRRNGSGPAAFVSAKGKGFYNNSNESFYTRFTTHFLVSYFFDESRTWLGRLLYRTRIGHSLLHKIWKSINTSAWKNADYDRVDVQNNGFKNLRPDTEIFWQNDSTGICQHPDFFDVICKSVKVHRQDIGRLTDRCVELEDGLLVHADAIILATGWNMSHPSMWRSDGEQDGLALSLGLPVPDHEDERSRQFWSTIEASAAVHILQRFSFLRKAPEQRSTVRDTLNLTPLRLYKGILPISDRTIAFVGQVLLGNNFRAAEVQALYAVAALDGEIILPSQERMEMSVARTIMWNRLRYLSKGRLGNWFYWDLVPYTDDLLQELGLSSHRHNSFWKDLFMPCFAHDLQSILQEYRIRHYEDNRDQ